MPEVPTTVTTSSVRAKPRSTCNGSQGEADSFSARQNEYLAGWPRVAMSISPGFAPPTFWSTRRTARPMVALARLPGPKAFACGFIPMRIAPGPFTITRVAAEPVVVEMPTRLKSPSARPSTAAATKPRYSGLHPAITALMARSRQVTGANNGASWQITASAWPACAPSMRSTRSAVGGTMGNPSPAPVAIISSCARSHCSSLRPGQSCMLISVEVSGRGYSKPRGHPLHSFTKLYSFPAGSALRCLHARSRSRSIEFTRRPT
jgi:hypothetical protein